MSFSLLDSVLAFLKMPFLWIGFGSVFLLWAVPKIWMICQDAFKKG